MTPAQPVSPSSLAFTTLWRLLVSAAGLTGSLMVLSAHGFDNIQMLSQLSSLLAGVYYLGLAAYPFVRPGRLDGNDPFLRASVLILGLITGGVYNLFMNGSLASLSSVLEHAITPILLLIDWCAFGRNQERMRPWHAVALPALPLVYLAVALVLGADGQPLYYFLDPSSPGFFSFIVVMLGLVIATGFALMQIGRWRRQSHRQLLRPPPPGVYDENRLP